MEKKCGGKISSRDYFPHTQSPRREAEHKRRRIMQLMTFNSLLMFDIVFIFFLFLIAVTCLMYYLPPPRKIKKRNSKSDNRGTASGSSVNNNNQTVITVASSNSSKSVLFVNGDNEPIESFTKCCKYCEKCKLIYEEIYSDRSYASTSRSSSGGCYLKAKECDVKNCKGPIYEV